MATCIPKETKSGARFYEIRVSRGRGQGRVSTRWYVPDGWSQKAIDRQLAKEAAEFERLVKAGEITTKKEQKARQAEAREAEARIQTLQQFVESVFMPALEARAAVNTIATYRCQLKNWIYPALGHIKLPDLTAADITSLLLDMQKQGKAHSTVQKVHRILSGILKMAYRMDLLEKNPMDKVILPAASKEEKTKTAESFTIEEFQQFMEVLEHEPLHWRVFFSLLADTGARCGEISGLHWSDIDFDSGMVTISKNLSYTTASGYHLGTPKSGKSRSFGLSGDVLALLLEYRATCENTAGFIFTQADGVTPMYPTTPSARMAQIGKRYGIPDCHPHKLRHTFASIAITNGADVVSVSQKLGHANTSITLRIYSHANSDSIQRASEIFREATKRASEA